MNELYKCFRPTTLDQVFGNQSVKAVLQRHLSKGTVPHALLFSGPSGCGKTTLARIVANELGAHLIEQNSADVRGIDNIREMAEQTKYQPLQANVRVWIIDEAHKLTSDAQSALLKVLEDTPVHTFFILCTTEPKKLLKTVQNRCTALAVKPLSLAVMVSLLESILYDRLEFPEDSEADIINQIVGCADGSARAALVMLDSYVSLDQEQRDAYVPQKMEEDKFAIDLARVLMNVKQSQSEAWLLVAECINSLTDEPETVRRVLLGYASSVLLKSKSKSAIMLRAAEVLDVFETPLYDSGKAGLILGCYKLLYLD